VIVVTSDIAKGATVTVKARSIEPLATPVAALPNPLTVSPTGPTATIPKS
jgi:hypothetical protein